MDKFLKYLGVAVVGLALICAWIAFETWMIQSLWNEVAVAQGLKTLSLQHALGLSLLCGFLFKPTSLLSYLSKK